MQAPRTRPRRSLSEPLRIDESTRTEKNPTHGVTMTEMQPHVHMRRLAIRPIPSPRRPDRCCVLLDGQVLIPKTDEPHWVIGCLFMAGARGPLEVTEADGSVRVVDLERETLRLITAGDVKKAARR